MQVDFLRITFFVHLYISLWYLCHKSIQRVVITLLLFFLFVILALILVDVLCILTSMLAGSIFIILEDKVRCLLLIQSSVLLILTSLI